MSLSKFRFQYSFTIALIYYENFYATILVIVKALITVDSIRGCKYSQVLLMMSEDFARNM